MKTFIAPDGSEYRIPTLEEWCTWLEDPENQDKQTTGCLKRSGEEAYCCLGANLNLAGAPRSEHNAEAIFFGMDVQVWPTLWGYAYGLSSNGFPEGLTRPWEGNFYPKDIEDKVDDPHHCQALSALNDDGGLSFTDIAKVIRFWWANGLIHDVA